jgi:alpha-1,2-mannosyltransferase
MAADHDPAPRTPGGRHARRSSSSPAAEIPGVPARPDGLLRGAAARLATRLPDWLLVPGLALFVLSTVLLYEQRKSPGVVGLDASVYRGAAVAFLSGKPVYDITYAAGSQMPYTYPPVSLLTFAPLAHMSLHRGVVVLAMLTVLTTMVTIWCALGLAGFQRSAGRVGITAAVTGLVLWFEPYLGTFYFGQINTMLMALVVVDFALPDRWRGKGVLIGVAAALKLTPGIFILYLLVTRRFRMAFTAIGGFVATTALGWAVAPVDSNRYWLDATFINANRVAGGNEFTSANQSLASVVHQWLGHPPNPALFYALVLVVLVIGMLLANRAYAAGDELAGVLATALAGLLISPVSWFHHWIWVAPLLVLLGDAVRRARGWARHAFAGLLAAVVAVFFAWPWSGTIVIPLFQRGIIWWVVMADDHLPAGRLRVSIAHAAYVLTTFALFAVAAWWLRPRRTATSATTDDPGSPVPRPRTWEQTESPDADLTVEQPLPAVLNGRMAAAPDRTTVPWTPTTIDQT